MTTSFDPVKRAKTLTERGLDFARADEVFTGRTYTAPDDRKLYPELRLITVGRIDGRMIVMVWTPVYAGRHVISMRKANDREQKKYGHLV